LTFAPHLASSSESEGQIQSSIRNLYLRVVLQFPTFAKRLPRWGANVGIGPLGGGVERSGAATAAGGESGGMSHL
jgi:hypothetical protein